jgi:hypothetical protein
MISQSTLNKWADLFTETCTESPACNYCNHYAEMIRKPEIFTDYEKTDLFSASMRKISDLYKRMNRD